MHPFSHTTLHRGKVGCGGGGTVRKRLEPSFPWVLYMYKIWSQSFKPLEKHNRIKTNCLCNTISNHIAKQLIMCISNNNRQIMNKPSFWLGLTLHAGKLHRIIENILILTCYKFNMGIEVNNISCQIGPASLKTLREAVFFGTKTIVGYLN